MNKTGSQRVADWRLKTKLQAIEELGGKCVVCGYDKCKDALDFHHKDPTKKTAGIAAMLASPKKRSLVMEEVRKCVLICSNCHRELHAGIISI